MVDHSKESKFFLSHNLTPLAFTEQNLQPNKFIPSILKSSKLEY